MSLQLNEGFAKFAHNGDELNVFYVDTGSPKDDASVLVLLHGSGPGGSSASFFPLLPVFYGQGIRAIAIDTVGFGKSSPVYCTENRSALNANALKAVLDTLGVAKASLLGTSMGAHTAAMFGLLYPDMTDKLVLVSGGTGGRGSLQAGVPAGVHQMMQLYQNPNEDNMRAFMKSVVGNPAIVSDELLKLMLAAANANPTHLENFFKGVSVNLAQFEDISPQLHKISAKTLVIWGTEDTLVPLEIGLTLVSRMPNANLFVMGGVGHAPTLERPQEFVKTVLGFLLG